MESITVVHGQIIGTETFRKRGFQLGERVAYRLTIKRDDPKQDITVVVNTLKDGSAEAYLPPAELPPRPIVREVVSGEDLEVGSGGKYDGGVSRGCGPHSRQVCVTPQHGGKLLAGTGKPVVIDQKGRSGVREPQESPEQFCISLWADTGGCEYEQYIRGHATATEEYR